MGQTRPLLSFYRSVFSNKYNFNYYHKDMWKNVNPVYGAMIQTHDIWNMSLLP